MNKTALMLMASGKKGEKGRRVGVEYEDWGVKDNYPTFYPFGDHPVEGKFRDRRGREHYDNGRYAPTSRMDGYPRYPDAEPYGDYDEPRMNRRYYPTYPIYDGDRRERRMNPIGFARDTSGSDATMPHYNEMERMEGSGMSRGYSKTEYAPHFDRQMAEEWMNGLENEDGTTGPHWNMSQAETVRNQKGLDVPALEFWVALNATYSDLCKMFKKYGINTMDAYVDFAKAFWLEDEDAVPDKLAEYFTHVVAHD